MMITNATLVSCTAPNVYDGRGGETSGVTTPATDRVCVDAPRRSQLGSGPDLIADAVAVMFAPSSFEPHVNAVVTYRMDGASADRSLQVASVTPRVHGLQSHVELLLRIVR